MGRYAYWGMMDASRDGEDVTVLMIRDGEALVVSYTDEIEPDAEVHPRIVAINHLWAKPSTGGERRQLDSDTKLLQEVLEFLSYNDSEPLINEWWKLWTEGPDSIPVWYTWSQDGWIVDPWRRRGGDAFTLYLNTPKLRKAGAVLRTARISTSTYTVPQAHARRTLIKAAAEQLEWKVANGLFTRTGK